jgi:hypothetical protein
MQTPIAKFPIGNDLCKEPNIIGDAITKCVTVWIHNEKIILQSNTWKALDAQNA